MLLAFAIVLLALDRMLRIEPFLASNATSVEPTTATFMKKEAFQVARGDPVTMLNVPCGVAFPSCPFGSTCANGFCVKGELGPLKEKYPLPVI